MGSTLFHLDSTFWLDFTLKLYYICTNETLVLLNVASYAVHVSGITVQQSISVDVCWGSSWCSCSSLVLFNVSRPVHKYATLSAHCSMHCKRRRLMSSCPRYSSLVLLLLLLIIVHSSRVSAPGSHPALHKSTSLLLVRRWSHWEAENPWLQSLKQMRSLSFIARSLNTRRFNPYELTK